MPTVAVVKGSDRTSNIKSALKLIEKKIDSAISRKGSRRLFIKVNTVDIKHPLSSTHPDAVKAVLEFFDDKFGERFDEIIIGDNTYLFTDNLPNPYEDAASKFKNVRLSDLREFPQTKVKFRTVSKKLIDAPVALVVSEAFTVSVTLPKTHDTVIFTGCSKNMFGCVTQKRHVAHALRPADRLFLKMIVKANLMSHQNIADAISLAMPDISVMDAWVGMEGDGPIIGTEVKLGWAMASDDAVALDRTAASLLGFGDIPYLAILEKKGLGTTDRNKIKIIKSGFNELSELSYNLKKQTNYEIQIMTDPSKMNWWNIDTGLATSVIKRPHRWKDIIKRTLFD